MPFTDDQIREAVIKLFRKYDKNNSGYIEQTEINQMYYDLGNELSVKKHLTNDQITTMLNSVDRNQDGKLTLD
jgi:Ca2+-binding EF-hand superfamily protein